MHQSEEDSFVACSIIDISRNATSIMDVNVSEFSGSGFPTTTILENLHSPPHAVCFRVVLWWLDSSLALTSSLLNVCGLGLKISPHFFETIHNRASRHSLAGSNHRDAVRSPGRSHEVIGSHVATVARHYLPGGAGGPPVLLVVGWNGVTWGIEHADDHLYFSTPIVRGFDEAPPLKAPNRGECFLDSRKIDSKFMSYRTQTYAEKLGELLKQDHALAADDANLPVICMIPLIHLDTLVLQGRCLSIRRLLMVERHNDQLVDERFWLRRHLEDSEASRVIFRNYIIMHKQGNVLQNAQYQLLEKIWAEMIKEARLVEAEVRDDMQLQTGRLSLEESKRSIEMSNCQIEESKRGEYVVSLGVIKYS